MAFLPALELRRDPRCRGRSAGASHRRRAPRRRGPRRRRLHRRPARRVRGRPAAHLGRRPVLGPGRRRRAFGEFLALSPLEELAWRTRIEGSRGIPERERIGPVVGWQDRVPRRHRRARRRLRRCRRPRSRTAASTPIPSSATCSTNTRSKAPTPRPSTAATAICSGWQAIEFPGDVQPRGYTDAEVEGARERRPKP